MRNGNNTVSNKQFTNLIHNNNSVDCVAQLLEVRALATRVHVHGPRINPGADKLDVGYHHFKVSEM